MRQHRHEHRFIHVLFVFLFLLILHPDLLPAQTSQYHEITDQQWGPGIDEAQPLLVDLNKDGKLELLVGSVNGKAMLFERIWASPIDYRTVWKFPKVLDSENEFAPTAGDLDKDGLIDLLVGSNSGRIRHFEQESAKSMNFVQVTKEFGSIQGAAHCTPCLTDLDQDGRFEILMGSSDGIVLTFQQSTTDPFQFAPVLPSVVSERIDNYCSLAVADLDGDGKLDLLGTNSVGRIYHFEQTAPKAFSFDLITRNFLGITDNKMGGVTTGDANGDGKIDIMIGNYAGRVRFLRGEDPATYSFVLEKSNVLPIDDYGYRSTILVSDLENDGLIDLLVSRPVDQERDVDTCFVSLLRQVSLSEPTRFPLSLPNFNGVFATHFTRMAITDLNADGLKDLLVSHENGYVTRYRQHAAGSLLYVHTSSQFSAALVQGNLQAFASCFTDLEQDGILDWIGATSNRKVYHFVQTQARDTVFQAATQPIDLVNTPFNYPTPAILDLDDNGRLDLLIGGYRSIYHYEQSAENPRSFVMVTNKFGGIELDTYLTVAFAKLRGPSFPYDLFVSDNLGGIRLYMKDGVNTVTESPLPDHFHVSAPSPNPANLVSRVFVEMGESGTLTYEVHDLLGRRVLNQDAGLLNPGKHPVTLATSGLPSGLYLATFRAGFQTSTIRLSVVH